MSSRKPFAFKLGHLLEEGCSRFAEALRSSLNSQGDNAIVLATLIRTCGMASLPPHTCRYPKLCDHSHTSHQNGVFHSIYHDRFRRSVVRIISDDDARLHEPQLVKGEPRGAPLSLNKLGLERS
jgi:hypothetical protein